jgi:hypothetical protein
MKSINVEELPEPVALAIESVVKTLKVQLRTVAERKPNQRVVFHTKSGRALTALRREDIYGDAL